VRTRWQHVVVALAAFLLPALAAASTRYDPRLRFRTLSTPRFDIHFHQGEEALAQRLAVIAESVASSLDATLGPASGRVQVILVAQSDLSNGWATPLPYNTIEITAPAPPAGSSIGNTTDWLSLVFTHEYTHIVHLSRGHGWIGGLRRAFGRMPVLFPNLYLPTWHIEGIAVYQETATTRQGRIDDSSFRAMLDVAAATRFEPIDRVNGGLVDWPGGNAPYLYGAYFHTHLADKAGPASLRQLTDETAGRIPFLGSRAFKKVYGRSLGDLWSDYAAASVRTVRPMSAAVSRLTHHGFIVGGPRVGPNSAVYYSIVNPHEFPALMTIAGSGGSSARIAHRYLGTAVGFRGTAVVFDQTEVVNQVALQSDLFQVDAMGGRVRRLTRGARAAYPDVSPDGATVVCTIQESDRRTLALVRLSADGEPSAPDVLISEPGVHFAAPRWSPDGRRIAVERNQAIVIVDPAAKRVERSIVGSRQITPTWVSNDVLLFAADSGRGFQIYRLDLRTSAVQVLEATGPDARSPELSPDGRTLYFVGYTAGGFDLFALPAHEATWTDLPVGFRITTASAFDSQPIETHAARPPSASYSPWRTIAPRSWTPIVFTDSEELFLGAATGSVDVLSRHAYAAQVAWTTSRVRPDWQFAYVYDRWWPTFFANGADDTDPWRDADIRTREVNAGVTLPFRRVRWSQSILGAVHSSTDELICDACTPAAITRRAVRGGWRVAAARGYGYSISLEDGWSATSAVELAREAWGAEGDGGALTLDTRGYLPVRPRHAVIALRGAAATTWGDDRVRRIFSASGSAAQPGGFRFGSDAIGLLRGVEDDEVIGRHAAVVNVDYRVPLRRFDRGWGTVPIFARVLHGAVFADVGHAWDTRFKASDLTASLGAELSLDVLVGFQFPLTVTTGAAWVSHDRGFSAFGRIGRAF
jgi:WD40-like Beta Propeller Repeat